jgi:hypothetical protein
MEIEIVPFEPRHLLEYQGDWRNDNEVMRMVSNETYFAALAAAGPAFSGFDRHGRLLGTVGINILWPGVGEAWAVFTESVNAIPIAFHRVMKRGLRTHFEALDLHRLHAVVAATDERAKRWIIALGFDREGTLREYGPNRADYIMYAMVRR